MCWAKAFGSKRVGIVVIVAKANGIVVDGDMEVEESGEVVAEEESITIISVVGEVEARWTKMSTAGREEASIAWDASKGVISVATVVATRVEAIGGDFGCSNSSSSPSWSGSS